MCVISQFITSKRQTLIWLGSAGFCRQAMLSARVRAAMLVAAGEVFSFHDYSIQCILHKYIKVKIYLFS